MLLIGLYTRVAAAILGLHLLAITYTMGFSQTGVRDFGLSIAAISTALHGPDKLCLDNKLRPQKKRFI